VIAHYRNRSTGQLFRFSGERDAVVVEAQADDGSWTQVGTYPNITEATNAADEGR